MTLKSLAHPDWPYTGTPHEWRGFAQELASKQQPLGPEATKVLMDNLSDLYVRESVYQKQNFGPELK
jgi:hypothetical protein